MNVTNDWMKDIAIRIPRELQHKNRVIEPVINSRKHYIARNLQKKIQEDVMIHWKKQYFLIITLVNFPLNVSKNIEKIDLSIDIHSINYNFVN